MHMDRLRSHLRSRPLHSVFIQLAVQFTSVIALRRLTFFTFSACFATENSIRIEFVINFLRRKSNRSAINFVTVAIERNISTANCYFNFAPIFP